MPRVVLDPNVLISALLTPGGHAASIIVAVKDGSVELVISPLLLRELEDVLMRRKFSRHVNAEEARAFIASLRTAAIELDGPPAPDHPMCADPDDEYLISLARAARVDALVSGDPHLLRLAGRIPVMSPRECSVKLIGAR